VVVELFPQAAAAMAMIPTSAKYRKFRFVT